MQVNWEKIKTTLWGAVGGAIALTIIGFTWGGWVMGGTAQIEAKKSAQEAVVTRLALICVEQFVTLHGQLLEKDPKLKQLKETNAWDRGDYVKKQGWATMPGEKEADIKVAGRCAELLVQR